MQSSPQDHLSLSQNSRHCLCHHYKTLWAKLEEKRLRQLGQVQPLLWKIANLAVNGLTCYSQVHTGVSLWITFRYLTVTGM